MEVHYLCSRIYIWVRFRCSSTLSQPTPSLSALSASRCSGGGRAIVWPRHYSGGRGLRPQRRPGLTTACAHGGDTTLGFTCWSGEEARQRTQIRGEGRRRTCIRHGSTTTHANLARKHDGPCRSVRKHYDARIWRAGATTTTKMILLDTAQTVT